MGALFQVFPDPVDLVNSAFQFCQGTEQTDAGYITLTVLVVAASDYSAVCPQTHGVIALGGDGDDAVPILDIALAVIIFAAGYHKAVCPQANHMVGAGGYGNDVLPSVC